MQWVYLRCSLFFSRFKTLGSFHLWSCPPCCLPAFFGDPTPTNTVSSSSGSSSLYTSTVLSALSSNAVLPPRHRHQTYYPPPAHFVSSPHRLMFLAVFLYHMFPLPFLTPSGFFNGILEVFVPGALNYYTLSRLILLTLYVSTNLTLTRLSLSGSLDSLLCDLIAHTLCLAFFLPMSHTLVVASSFSSGRAYPLNFLPPLFSLFP